MKITKREARILDGYKVGSENETVTNPYSKKSVELCPEAIAMFDIIVGCKAFLHNSYDKKTAELHDAALDVFIRNWPDAYMILLD